MATAQEIISTILDNAYPEWVQRIDGRISWDNIGQVGDFITSTENNMNTFMNALINKIAETHIKSKMFKNPLSVLKGTKVPYGKTIEELFINPVTSMPYQTDGTYLLKNYTPDGKACYFGQNRQSTYPVTITKPQLTQAFKSEQDFMSFYNAIISALYSGDNIDEFELMKRMLSMAIQQGNMQTVVVGDITANPKDFAKSISNISKQFTFNSTNFNGYNLVNKAKIDAGETAVQTFCPVEDQCLLIRADVQTEIDYEVLATMFHMEVAKLEAMTIVVDNFMEVPSTHANYHNVYAILCDRSAIQVRDTEFTLNNKFIESSLSWNVFLHHWQFLYLSMFANCVAFVQQ